MTRLNDRQRQVAELVAAGKSRKQIAIILGVSTNRVGQLITRIAKKVCDPSDGLEPRLAVFLYVHQQRWSARQRVETPEDVHA